MTKEKINRKDWRSLPYAEWNVLTVHTYFADRNRELFGVTKYLPMYNWRFEQARIKRVLNEHGAELLHRVLDECFRTYRPTREYPLLTAGFAINYRINSILPKPREEMKQTQEDEGTLDYGKLAKWL